MTKEFAKELDEILAGCIANRGRFESNEGEFSPITIGDRLEADGYGRWLCGNEFMIFPQGIDFYEKMGGYSSLFHKIEMKEEYEKQEMEHTKRQIQALKREPYLIAWAVITTIATIALSVISLIKS